MGNLVQRFFAALPDALTSLAYLGAWVAPSLLGPQYVKNLMLTMLIEFIVMHSSGFYGALSAAELPRIKKIGGLVALTAFYSIFILAFAFAFGSTWPLFAFGWLFASRFVNLWTTPTGAQQTRMTMLWAVSGVTYVLGAIATVMIPLPKLGLTSAFVASLALPGSGEWVERPQTVIAFGALYFGVQAWIKYGLTVDAQQNATTASDAARSSRAESREGI